MKLEKTLRIKRTNIRKYIRRMGRYIHFQNIKCSNELINGLILTNKLN